MGGFFDAHLMVALVEASPDCSSKVADMMEEAWEGGHG